MDAKIIEHVIDLGAGQSPRVVGIELGEYFLDGGLLHQLLGEVQVVVVLALLIVVPAPDPLDEGGVAEAGPGRWGFLHGRLGYNGMDYEWSYCGIWVGL